MHLSSGFYLLWPPVAMPPRWDFWLSSDSGTRLRLQTWGVGHYFWCTSAWQSFWAGLEVPGGQECGMEQCTSQLPQNLPCPLPFSWFEPVIIFSRFSQQSTWQEFVWSMPLLFTSVLALSMKEGGQGVLQVTIWLGHFWDNLFASCLTCVLTVDCPRLWTDLEDSSRL